MRLGRPVLRWRRALETDPATGRRVLGAVEEEIAVVARIQALRTEGQSYAAIARSPSSRRPPGWSNCLWGLAS